MCALCTCVKEVCAGCSCAFLMCETSRGIFCYFRTKITVSDLYESQVVNSMKICVKNEYRGLESHDPLGLWTWHLMVMIVS